MARIRVGSSGFGAGTAKNDTVIGDNKINILSGLGGSDTLWGRGGTDLLDGDKGNDALYGEKGNDILAGGRGSDILSGGAGKDAFVFDSPMRAGEIDTITDFNVRLDTIWLRKSVFKGVAKVDAFLKKGAFWAGEAAHDANDRIIYNPETGALLYDPDGTGPKVAKQFATLSAGLAMSHKDFFII